jgi:hypothetical protein
MQDVNITKRANPPKSPFEKGDSLVSPFPTAYSLIPPFRKGGLGGISPSKVEQGRHE